MLRKGWSMMIAFAAVFALGMPTLAWANEPTVVAEARTVVGENHVAYPQLEGLEDKEIQQAINDDIITKSDVLSHLVTLSTLREGGWGLVVDYEAFLQKDLLSVTISAKGEMPNGREGQTNTALCYDLLTGEPITLDMLFSDMDGAVAWMEEKAEETLADELSGYLENAELSPLPVDNFALDMDGITFYYPGSQFALLSGYSGACQFYYDELTDFLDWEGIPARIGLEKREYTPAQAREQIALVLESGHLPHVPVAIGDPMSEIVEKYRLLRVPDGYPGGKYYQMEAPAFRQVLILTDALESGYENTKVLGLQSMRGNLYGIQAGETTREEWREILGEPEDTAAFSESLAYDYAIPVGESDFYTFGSYQLRLHADENGVLHSIRLSQ